MEQQKLLTLLEKTTASVNEIESQLGMAQGTIAKAKSGARPLPAKWDALLLEFIGDIFSEDAPKKSTKQDWQLQLDEKNAEIAALKKQLAAKSSTLSEIKIEAKDVDFTSYWAINLFAACGKDKMMYNRIMEREVAKLSTIMGGGHGHTGVSFVLQDRMDGKKKGDK